MKKRYYPFGYEMRDGEISVKQDEMLVVRMIFTEYVKGASLKQLAEKALLNGVPYSQGSDKWSKNHIHRILQNEVYTGTKGFPPIVTEGEFINANQVKEQKARENGDCRISDEMKVIRPLLSCPACLTGLTRNRQRKGGIRWECPICKSETIVLYDENILDTVIQTMIRMGENTEIYEAELSKPSLRNMELMRMKNQISQEMDNENADSLLAMFQDYAALQYQQIPIWQGENNRIITSRLEEVKAGKRSYLECVPEVVKKVLLAPDGTIRLKLINEKIV